MNEIGKQKPRLHWVDIAKGILIVMVAMVHITGRGEELGISCPAIDVMHWWIEILAMKVMRGFFSQGVWMSTSATIVTILAAVFIPCLISELLNRPKMKWILGK